MSIISLKGGNCVNHKKIDLILSLILFLVGRALKNNEDIP
jgi:hypothetical protein